MKGIVSKIRLNGFLEVKTDEKVSVLELTSCSAVNVGDEIEGILDTVGGREVNNLTQKEPFDVYIHEVN